MVRYYVLDNLVYIIRKEVKRQGVWVNPVVYNAFDHTILESVYPRSLDGKLFLTVLKFKGRSIVDQQAISRDEEVNHVPI